MNTSYLDSTASSVFLLDYAVFEFLSVPGHQLFVSGKPNCSLFVCACVCVCLWPEVVHGIEINALACVSELSQVAFIIHDEVLVSITLR